METIKNVLDFSDLPRFDLMIAGLVFLFLLTFPVFPFSAFAMATMIQFLMFSLYGMGWNTIGGYGGQVDLGKAQYVGIGAYTTAVMLIRWDIPFWVSMPVGVFFAVCWSFIIGYPLFRLKGHYFAIATIATSLVLKDLFEVWNFVGAARGLEISPIKYHEMSTTIMCCWDFLCSAFFTSTGFANHGWVFSSDASKITRMWPAPLASTSTWPR